METDRTDEAHLQPYRDAVRRFGPTFEATLWGTEDAQRLRFDVLIDMIGLDVVTGHETDHHAEAPALLDIGCGRGDLAARLIERRIAFSRYEGVDALPEMIEAAGARSLPRCAFSVMNVMRAMEQLAAFKPDYCFISGTLNTMDDAAARRLVHGAFDAAAQGVAFNFLSDRHDPKWNAQPLGPARRFNTLEWLDWAFSLSSRISFAQDYLDGHDATIVMRH